MSQTRTQSLIEANTNTFAGFIVSYILAYTVLPLYGVEQSAIVSLEITAIYTVVSSVRNYVTRRLFNKITL